MLARIGGLATLALLPLLSLIGTPPSTASASSTTSTTSVTKTAYWLVGSDGGIFSFGGAPFYGSMGGQHLDAPIVGMAATATGGGYWEVASDGGIFTFGNASFDGSMGGQPLNEPIVGMAVDPATGGYWEVASDGGIFSFDAPFYGSMGGKALVAPIVGMAATPTGGGYWLVAADGGIFTFGNATFYGSIGGTRLAAPVLAMSATPTGGGYWEVASDGGIFTFGNATFYGSLGGVPQSRPIAALASPSTGRGYWITNDNGLVSGFGTARQLGSAPQVLAAPIVGMAAAVGDGDPSSPAFQAGSYGYDISNWQCGGLPPSPYQIGVVEVEGASQGYTNPCLAQEASWAGGGLNLYVYLTFRDTASSADAACGGTTACNGGYDTAVDAFEQAQAGGVDALVPWWLDVETPSGSWSSSTAANQAFLQGAIQGFESEGVNNVGVYASPGVWPQIVGTWRPDVPYWAAFWAKEAPATVCAAVAAKYADIPSGPLVMVQYSSPSYAYEAGGMSTAFDNDYTC